MYLICLKCIHVTSSFMSDKYLVFSNPFSARLSVPLRIYRADNKELRAEWKAVTPPQDAQPIYRLFMQWRHKGKLNVRLLYEGEKTSVVITGKLPVPNKKYVSVVLKNIAATTNFKHLAANILTSYPTKQALFPANKPGKFMNFSI